MLLNVKKTHHVVERLGGLLFFGKAIKPFPHLPTKTCGLGDPLFGPSRSTRVRHTVPRVKH